MATAAGGDLLSGMEDALEGRLHRTIERLGIERARAMATTAADRRCIGSVKNLGQAACLSRADWPG